MSRLSILLFTICFSTFALHAQQYQVTTLAGFTHDADGVKEQASFNEPEGIAIDKNGNLYVADTWNKKVRKITPDGVVSTFAGSRYGSANLIPTGIACDTKGNVYISSTHAIYKITSNGVMEIYAGSSEDGDTDGLDARFYTIHGIACDDSGNVFVTDASNDKIKKIRPDGYVVTYAGINNDIYSDSLLDYPHSIVIDKEGNLFVTDQGNRCIKKITADGSITRFPSAFIFQNNSEEELEKSSSESFISPCGIAIDPDNNLFVVDQSNNTIKKITKDGVVITIPVAFTDKVPSFGKLSSIAIGSNGDLYVTDNKTYLIYKITQTGMLEVFAGCGLKSIDGISTKSFFNYPAGMVLDKKGNVFISDKNNNNIRKIDLKGNVTTFAGSGARGHSNDKKLKATFNEPHGLAMDRKGNMYVADKGNNAIRIIYKNGRVETYGHSNSKAYHNPDANFSHPMDLCMDSKGNLYVLNEYTSQIKVIDVQKNTSLLVTSPALSINHNSISIDNHDNLYIGSSNSEVVLKITPDRLLHKIQDSTNVSPLTFRYPKNIAVDNMGNLYVTSIYDSQVQVANSKGNICLTIGHNVKGYSNGNIENAYFSYPGKLLLDAKGNIYLIDTGNSVIRKIVRTDTK